MQENPYSATANANLQKEENSKSKLRRIKRFNPIQLGKMSAVMYGMISLIFVPIFLIIALVSPKGGGMGFGLGMIIVLPIIYTVLGYIAGFIGAFIYNIIAKIIGGIEVEIE